MALTKARLLKHDLPVRGLYSKVTHKRPTNDSHAGLVTLGLFIRPHPQYGWDFPEEIPEKFRKDPGNALRAFPGIPLESTAGIPQAL